jgi:iron complex outermembrane recepter protein
MLMKESIGAAYVSADLRLSASASLTAGLRYEYSRTRMDDAVTGATTVDRKLGVFFPSLFFSKKIDDHSGWQFSYTKRISRPAYNDLSSFVAYNDPITVFAGNQFLKPAITNSVKAGYHYRSFSFSLLAGRDDNPIARYQLTASPAMDLMYISPQNLDYQNNLDFQADLPWRINSWWSMTYSLSGGWRRFRERYTPLPVEKSWFGYSLHGGEVFTLPKNLILEVSGWYNSSSYDGTVKTLGFGTIDIGIKKELGKNGGILQLSATDLFKTIKYKSYYGTLTPDVFDGHSWVIYNPESRQSPILRLSWSRSFGTGASKTQRGSGSQEEQLRIKKN